MNTEDALKASVMDAKKILGNRGNIPIYKVTALMRPKDARSEVAQDNDLDPNPPGRLKEIDPAKNVLDKVFVGLAAELSDPTKDLD